MVCPSVHPTDSEHHADKGWAARVDLHPVGVSAIHSTPSIAAHQAMLAEIGALDAESSKDEKDGHVRERWGSSLQFVLACIGYVVGLGNIWRFPSLAYEHGGGAFLIPYMVCSLLFGIPLVLLVQSIGQFTQAGPSVGLAYYAPALQGIGIAMSLVGGTINMYYNVVVSWTTIYLYKIVTGQSGEWSSCRNEWNTHYCESSLEDERCLTLTNGSLGYYYNGDCFDVSLKGLLRPADNLSAVSPAEEYFERYLTQRSSGMGDFEAMNWKVLGALSLVWLIVAFTMSKGVECIGKVAYFSATVPYFIVAALFIRGVTLDGSYEGIEFYLLKPDFSVVLQLATWKAALTHCCFSLSIGMGGIMAMSSYNQFNHKCYNDVLTVVAADNFMNVFGGTAVFATLGFMAKQLDRPVSQVVQSGTSLIFVAYPEAMARMPLSSLWAFLFFFMLFVLGITTSFGFTQVLVTCVRDEFPSLSKRRTLVTCAACFFFFLGGIVMCTNAGVYWFNVYNDFAGSTCVTIVAMCELIWIVFIYGIRNVITDFRAMFGSPSNGLQNFFGSSGYLIQLELLVIAPILGTVVMISTFFRDQLTYGKAERTYYYPWWAGVFGWCLVAFPTSCIPLAAIVKAIKFRKAGRPLSDMCKIQPELKSFDRINNRFAST